MSKKTLLNESQVRQFMKLASLTPLAQGFVEGLSDSSDLTELRTGKTGALGPKDGTANPGNGRGQGEAADGSLFEEEDPAELEGEIAHDMGDDSLEGDEEAMADEEEIGAEMAPASDEGRMVAVDDFLSALESALEDVMGDEVEIDSDEMADEEPEAEVEMDAEMDMGGEDVDVEVGDEEMLEEEAPYGGNKGDIPDADRKKETHSGKPGQASDEDVEERGEKLNKESAEASAEIVEQITKRVAARILKSALTKK
jgi:hypothetical protein